MIERRSTNTGKSVKWGDMLLGYSTLLDWDAAWKVVVRKQQYGGRWSSMT